MTLLTGNFHRLQIHVKNYFIGTWAIPSKVINKLQCPFVRGTTVSHRHKDPAAKLNVFLFGSYMILNWEDNLKMMASRRVENLNRSVGLRYVRLVHTNM
jgi:uncharacterized protein YhhL (DUF1145 family)